MKITSLRWLGALFTIGFGGSVLVAGCMAAPDPGAEEENEVELASPDKSAQGVVCGCGGPNPGCYCMGRCGSHNHWTNLGNPGAGNCTQHVKEFCSNKGGEDGTCWGWLK